MTVMTQTAVDASLVRLLDKHFSRKAKRKHEDDDGCREAGEAKAKGGIGDRQAQAQQTYQRQRMWTHVAVYRRSLSLILVHIPPSFSFVCCVINMMDHTVSLTVPRAKQSLLIPLLLSSRHGAEL